MTTETPKTVTQAISRVMAELPGIGKTREQGSGVQYAFRGIEAITAEAQTLFAKYGIVFAPRVLSHEIKDLTVNNKPWTDTFLSVEYDVYGPSYSHDTIDKITVGPIFAIGRDNSDKGANKAMTQAFKYALLQVLCISDRNDDADGYTHEADAPQELAAPVLPEGYVTVAEAKTALVETCHGDKQLAAGIWKENVEGTPTMISLAQLDKIIASTNPLAEFDDGVVAAPMAAYPVAEDTTVNTKRIHALIGDAQLPDVEYRAMLLEEYGVESSKDLTPEQRGDLIRRLDAMAKAVKQAA